MFETLSTDLLILVVFDSKGFESNYTAASLLIIFIYTIALFSAHCVFFCSYGNNYTSCYGPTTYDGRSGSQMLKPQKHLPPMPNN